MSTTDNRTLLEKANLALADIAGNNGILQPAQARRFIQLLIEQAKFMQMATVTPLRFAKQLVHKARFANRVMRPGVEGTALPQADWVKPNFTYEEHNAQLAKAEIHLTNEILEDNIEGDGLRDTIFTMFQEAMSRDMEDVIINGDTASSDPWLALFDGVLKQITSNVLDANGDTFNKGILLDMLRLMPNEYLRDKSVLKFLTSIDGELTYRDTLADRQTARGDSALSEAAPVGYNGIQVVDIPLIPEALGMSTDQTKIALMDPKNAEIGIWRNITIETDKNISEGVLIVVARTRFDVVVVEEGAAVRADEVAVAA